MKRLFAALVFLPLVAAAQTNDQINAALAAASTDNNGQHIIPMSCDTGTLRMDAGSQTPTLIYGHATPGVYVTSVEPLHDTPRVMAYPSINGRPARYMLTCPVKLTWNNGNVQYGTFTESQDANGQVVVSFNK